MSRNADTHPPGSAAAPDPSWRPLLLGTLSNLGASSVLVVRNLLDSYYAARISTDALAALTMTVPVTALMIGLSQGLSVCAGNAVAMRRRTAGSPGEAADSAPAAITAALLGGFALALALFALSMLARAWIEHPMLSRAASLVAWLGAGAPLLFLYGTLTSLLRGLQHAAASARATTIGLTSGAVLTPCLIFAGDGLATTTGSDPLVAIAIGLAAGYGLACALAAWELRRLGVSTTPCLDSSPVLRLLRSSVPVTVNNLVALGAIFAIVGFAGAAGTLDAAAFGVVFRIEQFCLVALNAVVLAMVPLAASAIGAGDAHRFRRTVHQGLIALGIGGAVLAVALIALAPTLAEHFELPAQARQLASFWLRAAAVALVLQAVTICATAVLQIRRPALALRFTAARLYVITLPALAIVGAHREGLLYPTISAVQIVVGLAAICALPWWLAAAVGAPSRAATASQE